ncbi:hypothetical protein QBK99_25795 [Corticibacterium sp. UT-5YL-CI-8]|nr:hypothetical protein [Tianweitania sp. UT-5YL-CI-8]
MAYPVLSPPNGVNIAQGSGLNFEPRIKKAEFGDGYSQRSPDGLNSNLATLEASFEVLVGTEAKFLLDFRGTGRLQAVHVHPSRRVHATTVDCTALEKDLHR